MKEVLSQLKELVQEFQVMKAFILAHQKSQVELLREGWVDSAAVMKALRISSRTLQALRDSRMLPYSRIRGKYYYKVEDLYDMLQAAYSPSKPQGRAGK